MWINSLTAYLQLQVVWVYRRSVIEVEVVLPTFHADIPFLSASLSSLGVRTLFNTHLVTAIGFGAIQSFVSAVERTLGIFPLAMQGDTDTDR